MFNTIGLTGYRHVLPQVVTYNGEDFAAAERFGLQVVTPKAFLDVIGG